MQEVILIALGGGLFLLVFLKYFGHRGQDATVTDVILVDDEGREV